MFFLPMRRQALTRTVFNSAITACSRVGALEDGMFLLREMWERGVARDVWTYNAAMSLCKKVGEWTRAVSAWSCVVRRACAKDAGRRATVIRSMKPRRVDSPWITLSMPGPSASETR